MRRSSLLFQIIHFFHFKSQRAHSTVHVFLVHVELASGNYGVHVARFIQKYFQISILHFFCDVIIFGLLVADSFNSSLLLN